MVYVDWAVAYETTEAKTKNNCGRGTAFEKLRGVWGGGGGGGGAELTLVLIGAV